MTLSSGCVTSVLFEISHSALKRQISKDEVINVCIADLFASESCSVNRDK